MRLISRLATAVALLVGIVAVSAVAQPPRGGMGIMGGGGGPIGLLNSKTVKEEIKLTEEQETKFKAWAKEYAVKMMEEGKSRFESLKDTPKEEWGKKMGEMMAEATKKQYTEIATILKEEQVKRLKQIDVQVMGLRAFGNPEVVAALKITDEQKDKLKDATENMMKESRELRDEYGIKGFAQRPMDESKAKEFDKKMSGITKETMEKIMGMMTDAQKTSWKEMTGATVDVAKIQTESRAGGMGAFQGKGKKPKVDD
jgi:Spy/CpxP family protein refolding chaperone